MASTTRLMPVFEVLKPLGKFQRQQFILYALCTFTASYSLYIIVFSAQAVDHRCAPWPDDISVAIDDGAVWPNQSDVQYEACAIGLNTSVNGTAFRRTLSCVNGVQYAQEKDFSIKSEFDLVCDKAFLSGLPAALFIVGQGLGAVFFSFFSDRFGRKRIHVITHALCAAGSVVMGFVPNFATYAGSKLLVGAVQQGALLSAVTSLLENSPVRYRATYYGILFDVAFSLAGLTLTLWAYFLRHHSWRVLQIASSAMGLSVFLQIPFLQESMRWLLVRGRVQEVLEIVKKTARVNKCNVSKVVQVFHQSINPHTDISTVSSGVILPQTATSDAEENVTSAHEAGPREGHLESGIASVQTESLTFKDMLRHRRMRANTLYLGVTWFVNGLVFFGLTLTSGTVTDSVYLGYSIATIVGIFGSVFSCLACNNPGLQKTAVAMFFVAKFAITGSFGTLFLYSPEMFPTSFRNQAFGIGSFCNRLGGLIAPFTEVLAARVAWAPGAVFGVLSLLVLPAILRLPETLGRDMPHLLADLQAWYTAPARGDDTKT